MNTEMTEQKFNELENTNTFKLLFIILKWFVLTIGVVAFMLPKGAYFGMKALIGMFKEDATPSKPKSNRKSK